MDTLQFSFFFAALLIAYILVHLRLSRFETYLQEVTRLKVLNERLKGVSDLMERVRLERVEALLEQLHGDLEELRDTTSSAARSTARAIASIGNIETVHTVSDSPVASPGARIRALIEERLFALGYGNLRILTDLHDASMDEQLDVVVECDKNHMPMKGRVTTRNGAVQDVQLQSAAQTFT